MTRPAFPRRSGMLYLLMILAAACSPAPSQADGAQETARRFSADDRRAAQALSIGNEAALQSAETPYDRALLCDYAVDVLATQLRDRAVLDRQQIRALEQAQSFFRRQAERLADGRPPAQIASARQEVAEANPEESRAVQIAIGCLRQLQ